MASSLWVVPVLLVAVFAAPQKLPENFTLCKRSESECLLSAIENGIHILKPGIPQLEVPPLDPLYVTAVDIGQGSGPVAVTIKFTDLHISGLSDVKLSSVKFDYDKYMLTAIGSEPKLTLKAKYEMNGQVLVLPVTGKGDCELVFYGLNATLIPQGNGIKKGGQTYWKLTKSPLAIHALDKLTVRFDNLFNGDKTLGQSMNTLLNENWKDLWDELRPAFETTFDVVFTDYANKIFSKVPYDDIFLQ